MRKKTLVMVQCAVFLAMAFVVRIIEQSFPITMGGVNFMKLGLSSPFILAPAILFGPIYGLIMGLLSDLMNLFGPDGGQWIPWLTITAALKGWLVGLIWQWIKEKNPTRIRRWVVGIFSLVGIVGVVNIIFSKILPNTNYGQTIMELNARDKAIPNLITYGFIVITAIVFLLVWVAIRIEKGAGIYSKERNVDNIFLLFIAIILPSVLQTTLNTFILRALFAQHAGIAFMLYYIPRVAKTLIVGVLTVLIVHDVLLLLYSKVHPQMYRECMGHQKSYKKQLN